MGCSTSLRKGLECTGAGSAYNARNPESCEGVEFLVLRQLLSQVSVKSPFDPKIHDAVQTDADWRGAPGKMLAGLGGRLRERDEPTTVFPYCSNAEQT